MVRNLSDVLAENKIAEKPAHVIEILGLAGTGKTTLSNLLSQHNKKVSVGVRLRKISYVPCYINLAHLYLPVYFDRNRKSRRITRGEIRAMVYLEAWHHALEREEPKNGTIHILDHGPIYRLALLREFGPESLKSQRFSNWWGRMLYRWSSTLDMIVWLDAPDSILLKRIHKRNRWHIVKDLADEEGLEYLTRFRQAFEQIVAMLPTGNGPTIVRLDTDREPESRTVERILAAFNVKFLDTDS
jgi:thymidylate kinase